MMLLLWQPEWTKIMLSNFKITLTTLSSYRYLLLPSPNGCFPWPWCKNKKTSFLKKRFISLLNFWPPSVLVAALVLSRKRAL